MRFSAVEFDIVNSAPVRLINDALRDISAGHFLIYIATVYIGLILLEWIAFAMLKKRYNYAEAKLNIYNQLVMEFLNAIIIGAAFVSCYIFLYTNFRLFTLPVGVLGFIIVFLLNDFVHYLDHRMQHRVGLLWAIHTAHHSSQEMNALISNRGTFLQLGMFTAPAYLILPLLGASPQVFLIVFFFGNVWGIFNHTEIVKRLGVFEYVLMTPSNHRVHHGTQMHYLDRNYGQVLVIWDMLFGTYQRETEPPIYGLVEQLDRQTVWNVQTAGFQRLFKRLRSTSGLSARMRMLLAPPGS